jgi:hypothetical protein
LFVHGEQIEVNIDLKFNLGEFCLSFDTRNWGLEAIGGGTFGEVIGNDFSDSEVVSKADIILGFLHKDSF